MVKGKFKTVEIVAFSNDMGLSIKEVMGNVDPIDCELTPYLDVRYAVIKKKGNKRTVVPFITVPILFEDEGGEITPSRIKRVRRGEPVVVIEDPFVHFASKKDKSFLIAFPEIKLEVPENMLQNGSIKKKKISLQEFTILTETLPIEVGHGKISKMIVDNFRTHKETGKIILKAQRIINAINR